MFTAGFDGVAERGATGGPAWPVFNDSTSLSPAVLEAVRPGDIAATGSLGSAWAR
jgi:hypothetical protein